MGDVFSCLQGNDKKEQQGMKNEPSITHFLSIPTNVVYSNDPNAESLRYNFKHAFKSNRKSIFNSGRFKMIETVSVEDVHFTMLLDSRGSGAARKIALDTYITSDNKNVTFLNGYIFIIDNDGKLILYKMFSNVRHYNKPRNEKLRECPVASVHDTWLKDHPGAIDFLFVGNILISPGYLNIEEVELLTQKLRSIPPFTSGKKLLFDENKPDVMLQVGERNFFAHKDILIQRSKVFEDMFSCTNKNIVTLDLNEDTVEEMLFFIYTDTSPKIRTMAVHLLQAADAYDLSKLKLMSEIELIKILDKDNVDDILKLAKMYKAENLFAVATVLMKKYFETVTEEIFRQELKRKKKKNLFKKALNSLRNT